MQVIRKGGLSPNGAGSIPPAKSSHGRNEAAIREIVRVLNEIFQEVDLFSRRSLRKFGVTGPQIWTMRTISADRGLTMSSLARRLYLHPSTVSGIVDRLEVRGYVTRVRQAEDGRSFGLILTKRGGAVLRKAPEPPRSKVAKGLERLPAWKLRVILQAVRVLGGIMQVPAQDLT